MMKLSCIVFLLSTLSIFAQDSPSDVIVEYIMEIQGQKVGKGVCFDLARAAAEKVNKRWYKEVWCNRKVKSKTIVAVPEPGDLINFSGVVMKNGDRMIAHIGIVYKILNDSLIVIADQNVCEKKEKTKKIRYYGEKRYICENSVVVTRVINIREKIKGKIIYLRVR